MLDPTLLLAAGGMDVWLEEFIQSHGAWVYGLLFGIIFAETGLVVAPFLPGDSLLFTAGVLCRPERDGLSLSLVIILLIVAAVLGDTVNYTIGRWFGARMFRNEKSRWLNPKHLEKTHAFFEKHGPKTIVLARWVPIVRTMAPFVAGMGSMDYRTFALYNVVGGVVWVVGCVGAGYLFGGLPIVRDRFEVVVLAIIFITIFPIGWEMWKARRERS